MEPLSEHTPDSDRDEDKTCLMAMSVTELISILRTAYRTVDYDRVEEALVDKEAKLKAEIGLLSEKLEAEKLERMNVEGQLKKYKEQCEKGKKAEERYEKLLRTVKKSNGLRDGNAITELRNKNRKLEDGKRRAESEMESWKRKCEELNERLLLVEKGAKSSMNAYARDEIRGNAEDLSRVRRNTDQGVSPDAIDTREMNEVVIRGHENGNAPADSSPSERKTQFVNLASDAENAQQETQDTQSDTEDGHDDRSIQQLHDEGQCSRLEVPESSGKSFWCTMPDRLPSEGCERHLEDRIDPKTKDVAKINKRNRVKQTIHHFSGFKTLASKKAKMDAQHQRKISGNEIRIEVNKHKDGIASPAVLTKTDTIVEKQSQEGSSDEMVIDERGDVSTQALETPEPYEQVHGIGSGPTLNQMLGDYISLYSTPSHEKGTSLGQQLQELKALNSMFTQVMKNQPSFGHM